jgi:hypothetical protein
MRMNEVSLAEKSLAVIEQIFLDYDVEIEEMPKLSPDNLYEIFCKIYHVVHSANPSHCCWDAHKSWREETYKMYEEVSK